MPFNYNEDKLPFVKITVTGIVTNEELTELLSKLESLFNRGIAFNLIANVRHMQGSLLDYGTNQVYTLSGWMKKHDENTKKYMSKTFILMDSSFIKFVLETIVFKIKPPNSTFYFCKNTNELRNLLKSS